jgi:hypothetical protein
METHLKRSSDAQGSLHDSGWSWRHGDHARGWRLQDHGLALAGVFRQSRVEGLVEGRSKPPGKKPISAAIKLKVIERTVKERRVNATHWSVRTMAKEMGVSHTSAQCITHKNRP